MSTHFYQKIELTPFFIHKSKKKKPEEKEMKKRGRKGKPCLPQIYPRREN